MSACDYGPSINLGGLDVLRTGKNKKTVACTPAPRRAKLFVEAPPVVHGAQKIRGYCNKSSESCRETMVSLMLSTWSTMQRRYILHSDSRHEQWRGLL